jgi:hypothetical protein
MHFRGGPGTLLVGLEYSPDTEVWDVAAGRQVEPLKGLGQPERVFADGTRAVVRPGSVKRRDVIDLATRRVLFSVPHYSAALSPDNRWLASWVDGATSIDLWDATAGTKARTLGPLRYYDKSVSFTADGSRVAVASGDRDVHLWETATGRLLQEFRATGEGQADAALSPDGRWVVSVSNEWVVRLWDARTGRELRQFNPRGPTHAVRFTADGTRLVMDANGPFVLDPGRVARERALRPAFAAARQTLATTPGDPAALAAVGQWLAHHGVTDWGTPLLESARAANADFPPETLARAYWRLGRTAEARAEFTKAAARARTPAEKTYFELCAAVAGR